MIQAWIQWLVRRIWHNINERPLGRVFPRLLLPCMLTAIVVYLTLSIKVKRHLDHDKDDPSPELVQD